MAKDKRKKQNEKEKVKPDIKKGCCKVVLIITSLFVAGTGIVSYFVYEKLSRVPDIPSIELNAWWGKNDTKLTHDKSIRPFRIVFSEGLLDDLRVRFDSYRSDLKKKNSLKDTGWTYGVNSQAFAQFFSHWLFKYKYPERERFLNKFNHFKTNIQGLDIHFIHVKPEVNNYLKVVPLLLLHGWPGSVREFYEAIPLLTKPRLDYDFVFEIIAPSLPGFAYSEGAVRPGLGPVEISVIMRNLMQRLGFSKYYIQGGDFGHVIGSNMATIFPKEVLGFHTNFPINMSKKAILTWLLGSIWPTLVEPDYPEKLYPIKNILEFYIEETGYSHIQGTKPDTVGIALQDSPVGLAAYILEKFMTYTDPTKKYEEDGGLSKFNYTDLLDNIMLYWSTNCITTSIRLYKETVRNPDVLNQIPSSVPTWALRLKHEVVFQPEFMLRWKYPNLMGTTTLDYGGHFAAFELPKEYADDVFKSVNSFLKFNKSG